MEVAMLEWNGQFDVRNEPLKSLQRDSTSHLRSGSTSLWSREGPFRQHDYEQSDLQLLSRSTAKHTLYLERGLGLPNGDLESSILYSGEDPSGYIMVSESDNFYTDNSMSTSISSSAGTFASAPNLLEPEASNSTNNNDSTRVKDVNETIDSETSVNSKHRAPGMTSPPSMQHAEIMAANRLLGDSEHGEDENDHETGDITTIPGGFETKFVPDEPGMSEEISISYGNIRILKPLNIHELSQIRSRIPSQPTIEDCQSDEPYIQKPGTDAKTYIAYGKAPGAEEVTTSWKIPPKVLRRESRPYANNAVSNIAAASDSRPSKRYHPDAGRRKTQSYDVAPSAVRTSKATGGLSRLADHMMPRMVQPERKGVSDGFNKLQEQLRRKPARETVVHPQNDVESSSTDSDLGSQNMSDHDTSKQRIFQERSLDDISVLSTTGYPRIGPSISHTISRDWTGNYEEVCQNILAAQSRCSVPRHSRAFKVRAVTIIQE